mmetsp:Transcript_432/g.1272  ORF Transcript_432/g.1272 Transcript_432/m.1272 type:complete len:127 (+) Transcript_432:1370-1750(+)
MDGVSAISRAGCIDRYHQHTIHCSSCSEALTNIKRVQKWAIGGLIAAAAYRQIALMALAFVVIQVAQQLEQGLTKGPYPPPRNMPLPDRHLMKKRVDGVQAVLRQALLAVMMRLEGLLIRTSRWGK